MTTHPELRDLKQEILVADDASVRKFFRTLLDFEGYQLTSVTNGEEALDAVGEHMFGLVLLDVMMPRLTGHRGVPEDAREFVDALDLDPDADLRRLSRQGVGLYLRSGTTTWSKPFEPIELIAGVRSTLERAS